MAETRSRGAYNYKSLLCTNIPELFLDKFVARTHFERFGKLVNFVLRPRRMTCTVSYSSESEAALALREGAVYNGHRLEICHAEMECAHSQKSEECFDPDVQAELSVLSTGWRNEYPFACKVASSAVRSAARTSTASASILGFHGEREREPAEYKTARQELEAVMRKPAHNSEQKYRILDARDKLLRLNQRRGTTATDAKRLQGYCADMCPEKERVLREFQRQVAVYELQPNSDELISHELALKQYSRSSADQETPLPHELRSESAMHMTMSYLMQEIMDISERQDAHLGDWFHFVWDRTRSIRKEITQQELCSLGAVKLVEQCARFHIHCAARLIAEDPSVFDSKINAENLTKCLQTLKYMYHDLRLTGVQCPREAEFRGYIVLLNLADAKFLWDIGQLPIELQNCPQIRRAIQFYLALQDTNFVRFFQLLRDPETSYLSACILVSYFSRLRVLALHRLVQAYRAPKKYEFSSLPVSFIRRMMYFPSDAEAAEFAECCGLNVNQTERVELTRIHSPQLYKLRRQIELVESKRHQSVGECICGEALPPKSLYINHHPHNSFDEQGYLKSTAWTARDQFDNSTGENKEARARKIKPISVEKKETQATQIEFKVPIFSAPTSSKIKALMTPPLSQQPYQLVLPHQQQQQLAKHQQQNQTTQTTKMVLNFSLAAHNTDDFRDNIFATMPSPPKLGFLNVKQPPNNESTSQLRQQYVSNDAKQAALLELQKAKQAESELGRQQRQLEQQLAKEEQQRQQLAREEQDRNQQAAALEAEAVAEKQRQQQECLELQLDKRSQQLFSKLIDQQVERMCHQNWQQHQNSLIMYQTLLDHQIARLVREHLMRANFELGLKRHYWKRWRFYRRSQQLKNALFSCLPLNFCSVMPEQLVDANELEQPLRLIRRYRQGESCDFNRLLAGKDNQCSLKLDLWELLARTLPKLSGARHYFKLLLSLPEDSMGLVVEHALDCGLLLRPAQSHLQKTEQDQLYMRGLSNGVALCVYKLKGMLNEQLRQHLADADGIIFFMATNQFKETRKRLHQLCSNSGCRDVALIVQQQKYGEQMRQEQLVKQMNLDALRSYRIYDICSMTRGKQKTQMVARVHCAVQFLAKQPHRSRGLLQQVQLQEWLIYHLGDELFARLRRAGQHDEAIRRFCSKSPHFCVQLYNDAVSRLQIVAGEQLDELPQLPIELRCYVEPLETSSAGLPNRFEYFIDGWQLPEKRKQIVQLLKQAKLPQMQPLPPHQQLHKICEWLLNYAQLSAEETLVESLALRAIQTLELQLNSGNVNYLDIVEIFARKRLQLVLRRNASAIPSAFVYQLNTMQSCFQNHWYYEHQPKAVPMATSGHQQHRVMKQLVASASSLPEQQKLIFEEVMHKAQTTLDKYQQKLIACKTLPVFNEQLDQLEKLECKMQRFDHDFTSQYSTGNQPHLQKQAGDIQTVPSYKRQRLSLFVNDSITTLDRTEHLLHACQTNEQRRRQVLQRGKQIL